MKLIKTTRKYVHIRMTEDEFEISRMAVKNYYDMLKTQKWFLENHTRKTGRDDYGSYESYWVNNRTGNITHPPVGIIV